MSETKVKPNKIHSIQNLLVFGGKGGVGKSSISTATAVYLARKLKDKKILLISFDIAHNLSDLFKMEIGNNITSITENLSAIEPDPDLYAEKYTQGFATKLRKLLKSTFIVGQIPELENFVNVTFQAKTIPLALKNSIFFQSLLDAENPIESLGETKNNKTDADKVDKVEEDEILESASTEEDPEEKDNQNLNRKNKKARQYFDIIIADFPPTGNMIALFEIPENHIQQLLKYSLEMVSTVQNFINKLKKVGKVMNPFSWFKKEKKSERRNQAQEILDSLHAAEQRGKRISQLMKGIGSLRLVTIPEKPSYEEIKRGRELTEPYISLDAVHINRLIPESLKGKTEFLDKLLVNQEKYTDLIDGSFSDFKIWKSHYLDEEPIGLDGLYTLAEEVYKDTPVEEILNPLTRDLVNPEFIFEENPIHLGSLEKKKKKN
jgi:arsenite/tail-anchored protein-transporting ATPase